MWAQIPGSSIYITRLSSDTQLMTDGVVYWVTIDLGVHRTPKILPYNPPLVIVTDTDAFSSDPRSTLRAVRTTHRGLEMWVVPGDPNTASIDAEEALCLASQQAS